MGRRQHGRGQRCTNHRQQLGRNDKGAADHHAVPTFTVILS